MRRRPLASDTLRAAGAAALWPFSALYWIVVSARNLLYDCGVLGTGRAGVPVVSVGNLAAGGTGKTPFAVMLAGMLAGAGRRVAVVSHGYRRRNPSKEPLVVSDGREVKCPAAESGDEPGLMARRLLGVHGKGAMVIVCADRISAARKAGELGADAVVLDDGFQHRRLWRDIDIVLLDQKRPFGNGILLPAGRLREGPRSLARAGAVVLTRSEGNGDPPGVRKHLAPGIPVFHTRHVPGQLIEFNEWRNGKPGISRIPISGEVLLFSGIASPSSFERSAASLGLKVGGHIKYPDHHGYRPRDLKELENAAAGFEAMVTTEKDAIRLPPDWSPGRPLLVLPIDLEFEDPEERQAFRDLIMRGIGAR